MRSRQFSGTAEGAVCGSVAGGGREGRHDPNDPDRADVARLLGLHDIPERTPLSNLVISAKNSGRPQLEVYQELAKKFPQGLADVAPLPEELSGEVNAVFAEQEQKG